MLNDPEDNDGPLWTHHDFMLLWTGQAISDLGSAVTALAMPVVAVTLLAATPFQTGLLAALGTLGWLVLALPAGAGVDRMRKRPLMIGCDVARAVLVASVPAAVAVDRLTTVQLYVVALLCGLLVVYFEVACQSYVPTLLAPRHLVQGVGWIGTANALSSVIGPASLGVLVALCGGIGQVLLVDAVSFAVGVGCLIAVRRTDPPPSATGARRRIGPEIAEGLRFVLGHAVLRRVVACSATSNVCDVMTSALIVLFLVRDLHASAATIGLVLGLGGVGGVVGGLLSAPLARLVGSARALWLGKLVLGGFSLCIPLARPGWGIWLASVGLFAAGAAVVSYNVLQIAYRQLICPPHLLGRMNASVRWMIRGLMPAGGLLAGGLGTWMGVRPALAVAVVGGWAAVFWLVLSPLRHLRDVPAAETVPASA
jgi:MFS family permease